MGLLEGKTGVVFGVANKRSIAWAIAKAWHEAGARLAFTYQGERLKDKVADLVETFGEDTLLIPCDVTSDADIDNVFQQVGERFGKLDLLLHSVAFAPREALEGDFLETTREAFAVAHDVSAYSLVALARGAAPLMSDGGSIVAMSYYGAAKVIPHYNVMGVAKAALEASVRYLAADLGPQGIRVNAISAGPMRTLAGSAIGGARHILKWNEKHAPMRRNVQLEDIGGASLYLLSDLSRSVTGEVHHVDSGYNVIGVPQPGVEV
jgi:enoyl-[acyl-carrier protein] reductase I